MAIKSDRWIKTMARDHGMIEPFVESQVRYDDGESLISYGTSSYGYDVRCANEFKVFTNINSAVVDPKSFDENSFIDLDSEVCVIPPNSFVLARTVEYFRIPRNVLTICLANPRMPDVALLSMSPLWSLNGKDMLLWNSQIPLHCQQKSTPTKVLPR